MPIKIPRPLPPPPEVKPPAEPPVEYVTRQQMEAALSTLSAEWVTRIEQMQKALLAAIPKPAPAAPPVPRKPTAIKFEFDANGNGTAIITPEN